MRIAPRGPPMAKADPDQASCAYLPSDSRRTLLIPVPAWICRGRTHDFGGDKSLAVLPGPVINRTSARPVLGPLPRTLSGGALQQLPFTYFNDPLLRRSPV